ncbi:hypothetical protein ACMBCN_01040, partial [Candidatus Liberibacter asiaticus]|nr:hypothetical protein [Candidatus Liberibacter asiaticus]
FSCWVGFGCPKKGLKNNLCTHPFFSFSFSFSFSFIYLFFFFFFFWKILSSFLLSHHYFFRKRF